MKKISTLLIVLCASLMASAADAVPSGELFATYQKQGDTFYRGNTTIDEENPDAKALGINYYIVSCGQTMLFRAVNPSEDINFGGAAWEVQLRVYNSTGGSQSEVQACSIVDQHHHFTGDGCQTHFSAVTEDLQIHFFLSSNIEGGYRRTETIGFNRASINNPIEDAIAPTINPEEVMMTEEDGKLIFTFGDVTADDAYFYYVGDKDHSIGNISLTNTVTIDKPAVKDGTTYSFQCYAVDYNGNKSAGKAFTLEMPFDSAVDLAHNRPCTAGAVQNDNTADKAVNGNADNFWTSFGQGTAEDWWWKVDLTNAYDITDIIVHFNDCWGAYGIYSSLDDAEWTAVVENETAESNSTKTYSSLQISGRYLKVVSSVSQIGIREFEVYGSGLADLHTAIDHVNGEGANSGWTKAIENGQVVIIRDGVRYTILGTRLQIL
ncbi:MAG: discoidin domain-containing protein [Paludibacteraceae bacterium]|nr:discoidin domain-containing protein [Paludibacteraceae bacterium]